MNMKRPLELAHAGRTITCTLIAIASFIAAGTSHAETQTERARNRSGAMQSLDQQVQDIKSDVLVIAAELRGLEEKLLYPSNTQVALFVSVNDAGDLAIDSARISIDGELVAHHIYSFKELEALSKGGVQRIYTGNVTAGEHRMEVAIQGKRSGGQDFDSVEQFAFRKEVDPKNVGITLTAGLAGSATIAIEDW
jgi:hypothetical protein